MRYLLGGYYGMRNVGDDLLLYVTLAEVARIDPDAVFTVVSSVDETIPPGVRARVTPGGRRLETLRQLLRHDIWLFGGGGLLQDGSPHSLHYLARLRSWAVMAKGLRKKIAFLAIGVGPLDTPRGKALSKRLLGLADFVTVRDQESADLASELAPGRSYPVTGDLAMLMPTNLPPQDTPQRPGASRKVLGVSLLPYAGSLGKDRAFDLRCVETVAGALNRLLARHAEWEVCLFEFFSGSMDYGDAAVLKPLREQLRFPNRVSYRPYQGDFLSLYGDLRECSAFLGMRFHSCVFSYLAGVPCLMLAYHPKSHSLAARFHMPPSAVAALSILERSGELEARLERLIADGGAFRPGVPVGGMVHQSAQNISLLAEWLNRLGVSSVEDGGTQVESPMSKTCVRPMEGP